MGERYDALMRRPRRRDQPDGGGSLRDRLRRWVPRRRSAEGTETPTARDPIDELRTSSADAAVVLIEELASLQVSVDALDDRISAEVVEREAKLLEEIRRGMRGLEIELSDRFAAAALEMQRSARRSTALVIVFVALLAGLVVGVLSVR